MPLTINKRGHEIDCEAKAVTVGGRLETTFRTAKHLLATRPIFHRLDETIRGHVFASFLALVVKAELEQRIADLGRAASWTENLTDLDSLTETAIAHDHKRFLVRSSPRPAASLALGPPASPCRRPSSPSPATDPPSKM